MPNPIVPRAPFVAELESPLLQRAAITRRLNALFRAMASDYLLREQFVTDPAQILSEYVHGAGLSPATASVSNQLLYGLMANPKLRSWLTKYATDHHDEPPPRDKFLSDLGHA